MTQKQRGLAARHTRHRGRVSGQPLDLRPLPQWIRCPLEWRLAPQVPAAIRGAWGFYKHIEGPVSPLSGAAMSLLMLTGRRKLRG